jgi:LPS sulfotransferase NodH
MQKEVEEMLEKLEREAKTPEGVEGIKLMRHFIRIIHIIATTSRNFDIANLLIYIKDLGKAFEKWVIYEKPSLAIRIDVEKQLINFIKEIAMLIQS